MRDGDEWVINGSKTFITNAVRADFCLLVTRTNKGAGYEGFSLFLVDTDLPGWNVQRHLDKLGMRSSDTGEISIQDVRVPASALLGERGQGLLPDHVGAPGGAPDRLERLALRRAARAGQDHRVRAGAQGVRQADRQASRSTATPSPRWPPRSRPPAS